MMSTDQRPIALIGIAQGMEAVGAKILEAAQFVAEALPEDRARCEGSAELVPVVGDIVEQSQKRPGPRQGSLFATKNLRIA